MTPGSWSFSSDASSEVENIIDASHTAFRTLVLHQDRPLDYSLIGRTFILDHNYPLAAYALLEEFRICGYSSDDILYYVQALLHTGEASEASALIEDGLKNYLNSSKVRYLRSAVAVLSGDDENQGSNPGICTKSFSI